MKVHIPYISFKTFFVFLHVCFFSVMLVGVGDDLNSYAFDGSRCRAWHGGAHGVAQLPNQGEYGDEWRPGDIVTVLIDMDEATIAYMLNGQNLVYNLVLMKCVYPEAYA